MSLRSGSRLATRRIQPSTLTRATRGRLSYGGVRYFSWPGSSQKERLVILGSGWGGYEILRGVDKKRWDVTMVSPNGYFNFTPLLASCSVGTLEFRCAVEPVRRYAPRANTYQAWCDKIDFAQKTLTCFSATPLPTTLTRQIQEPQTLSDVQTNKSLEFFTGGRPGEFKLHYDKLVIAVGAYSQTFGIPGVKEHAYFLKDVKDARAIRNRVLECFDIASQPTLSDVERRKLLNFCIVGGGPTGVEFAAELHDLIASDIARHYGHTLARMARINLYDVAPTILGTFDRGLAEYAEKKFSRDGIVMRLGHHVERVSDGILHVKEQGDVPFGLLVWSTGLAPNPLIESITEVKKDKRTSSLLTDDFLRVLREDGKADPNVWAIGDAARMESLALPATAQVAQQKAKYLTKIINRIGRGDTTVADKNPFEFHNQGSLAYLGDWKAIYDRTGVENGPKGKDAGRLAWLLWRSAYFTRTLSFRNKITVPAYWFLNWIFGRDLTRF